MISSTVAAPRSGVAAVDDDLGAVTGELQAIARPDADVLRR